ncbi:MAG: phage head-tail connector protein [Firmicutes bacterium]|nr:phage head-tail connector protein [Bacillota bacterium]
MTIEEQLETLKTLLNMSDNANDAILKIYLQMALQRILNYINRNVLPQELYFTLIQITADLWAFANPNIGNDNGGDQTAENSISSISLGGAKISYGGNAQKAKGTAVLQAKLDDRIKQTAELNQFRSLFRVLQ